MTTDRDMDRAQELLCEIFGVLPMFDRAVKPREEDSALRIIAAALAAERAPLEAQLAEARAALRDLLAGLSLDDAPRRAAIDRARETVRRWDAGEPQRPVAWIEEERAPHAVGDRVRANLDGVWHAGDVLGVENIAGPGSPPRWRYLVRVDPGVGYLGNTVWAYTVERIDDEPQVTGHCPTCATVARERERAEGQREMLRAALRDEQAASHRELEELRAKLAEAERERDGLREEADQVDRLRDDEHDRANAAENERDDARAEVERLRAELADVRRTANMLAPIGPGACNPVDVVRAAREQEAAESKSEPPKVGDRVRVVRCCPEGSGSCCLRYTGEAGALTAIADARRILRYVVDIDNDNVHDAFYAIERIEEQPSERGDLLTPPVIREGSDLLTRGELIAALRETVDKLVGGTPAYAFAQLADKLETDR